ncbi:MAG TPA: hypothetical protein VHA53_03335 [Nitrolancea sp.]|nr:hypothetical protein [Nitrolancea sp.]
MLDTIDAAAGFSPAVGKPITDSTTPVTRITLSVMHPMDTYFWEKVAGPVCRGGQLHETWCYVECAGGTCQPLWCEDRIVGSC